MIADGLHLLLNLPDLGWATADTPKQLKRKPAQQLKKKSTLEPNCKQERNHGSLLFVDTSLLIHKTNFNPVRGISEKYSSIPQWMDVLLECERSDTYM